MTGKLVALAKVLSIVISVCFSISCIPVWAFVSSSELESMFSEDQNDRLSYRDDPKPDKWKTVLKHDEEHRERVRDILKQNKIKTAQDYYHAAMIMQHGSEHKDHMLAHILACAAMKLGSKPAIWLSAASFDRLLLCLNQPQIFGTQLFGIGESNELIKPADTSFLPDSIKTEFNVPKQAPVVTSFPSGFDLEEAAIRCESIVAGEVIEVSDKSNKDPNWDLRLHVENYLKGSKFAFALPVWLKENSTEKKPVVGSKYIICVENALNRDGKFDSYLDKGVVPYSQEAVDKISAIVKLDKAYDLCESVLVAEIAFVDTKEIRFNIDKSLKGSRFGAPIYISMSHFNKPVQRGDKWFLFNPIAVPVNGLLPLLEDGGALPFTDELLNKMLKIKESKKNAIR